MCLQFSLFDLPLQLRNNLPLVPLVLVHLPFELNSRLVYVDYSWADAAKFLTGFSSVGSIAIPAILRHADLITGGAMWIEFTAFFILLSTVVVFNHVSHEDYYG